MSNSMDEKSLASRDNLGQTTGKFVGAVSIHSASRAEDTGNRVRSILKVLERIYIHRRSRLNRNTRRAMLSTIKEAYTPTFL